MKTVFYLTLSFLLTCFFTLQIQASDYITPLEGERIEVHMVDLNDSLVSFYLIHSDSKILYTMPLSNIGMIEMENGTQWRFNATLKNYLESHYPKIERIKRRKYAHKGVLIAHDEYSYLLKQYYPSAYKQYNNGRLIRNTGRVFLGLGPASMLAGLMCATAGHGFGTYDYDLPGSSRSRSDRQLEDVGVGLVLSGATILLTAVPLIALGSQKMTSSYNVYKKERQHAVKQNSIELVPYIAPTSVGLAINF